MKQRAIRQQGAASRFFPRYALQRGMHVLAIGSIASPQAVVLAYVVSLIPLRSCPGALEKLQASPKSCLFSFGSVSDSPTEDPMLSQAFVT